LKFQCLFLFFRSQFCDIAKVAMIQSEHLARFGYKINMI
jgi:hypothetical protein